MDKFPVANSSAKFQRRKPMYFIGIDISKFKHDCAIIDEAGDTVTASWSFANNCEGFPYSNSCWMPWMDKRK